MSSKSTEKKAKSQDKTILPKFSRVLNSLTAGQVDQKPLQ